MKQYAQFIEETINLNPIYIVGSGSSAGAGISGMGALAEYLVKNVSTALFDAAEAVVWEQIKHRLVVEKKGLEQALQEAGDKLSLKITTEIVHKTWRCISADEAELIIRFAAGEDPTGFGRLFRYLKGSNNKIVNIITTNYDHLIEWSAAAFGWHIWDGFNEGAIAGPLSSAELAARMKQGVKLGKRQSAEIIQHLRIYKPHGSLSWFRMPDGSIKKVTGISSHHLKNLNKVGIKPVIVTPGTGKYLETHFEPYSNILSEMKRSIDRASGLIFIGFGFNDIHIQSNFLSKLRNPAVPVVIITKSLSPSFFKMADSGEIRNYLAIQQSGDKSQVFSDRVTISLIDEPEHWTVKGLLRQAWGDEDYAKPV
ncbi:SIR2 family protein [Paenibacillus alkalitolerans]|uniref:SIR2 family protein n=1 Tax=Paenibacillus alkalitolerans TaxID=2799335 RepID=UPI0018F38489|nr:SIR2 family protein [Paenibacillus alkalitolerans]